MKLFISYIILVLSSFWLSGCAMLTGVGTDNTPAPSKLTGFQPQLTPRQIISAGTDQEINQKNPNFAPVMNNNIIFTAGSQGKVSALNAQTAKIIWQTPLKQPLISVVGIVNNLILAGSQQGGLYALDESTGKLEWHAALNQQISAPPVAAGNVIIVKTVSSGLIGLSTTGHILWRVQHDTPLMILSGGSAPQIAGNKVIVGFADGKLAAYTVDQGRLIWETQIAEPTGASSVEQMVDITANPRISGSVVYVVTYQGNISAVNVNTGQILWQQPLSSYTGLALSNTMIYVTDSQGIVWGLNRQNGKIIFKQDNLKYRKLTAPVMMGQWVVAGDAEGYLHWLNPETGETAARLRTGSAGIIWLGVDNLNNLYAFNQNSRMFKYTLS